MGGVWHAEGRVRTRYRACHGDREPVTQAEEWLGALPTQRSAPCMHMRSLLPPSEPAVLLSGLACEPCQATAAPAGLPRRARAQVCVCDFAPCRFPPWCGSLRVVAELQRAPVRARAGKAPRGPQARTCIECVRRTFSSRSAAISRCICAPRSSHSVALVSSSFLRACAAPPCA